MHVRELLIAILRQVIGLRAAGESVEWEAVFTRLEEAETEALAQITKDPGVAASFISAVNLIVDCVCDRVEVAILRDAVDRLDVADGWESGFAIELLRKGSVVKLPEDSSPTGWTAVKWTDFLRYYAAQLGYPPDDKRRAEQLWSDVKQNFIRIPLADLDLADPIGGSSTWVTDDRDDGRSLTRGDPQHDLYDAFGLTWRPPNEKTRAILISCPLSLRHVAARSLHCPTAVDGGAIYCSCHVSRKISRGRTTALQPRVRLQTTPACRKRFTAPQRRAVCQSRCTLSMSSTSGTEWRSMVQR